MSIGIEKPREGSAWTHYKRGGRYVVTGVGTLQSAAVMKFYDGTSMVFYVEENGKKNCRPLLEWEQLIEVNGEFVCRFQPIEEKTDV